VVNVLNYQPEDHFGQKSLLEDINVEFLYHFFWRLNMSGQAEGVEYFSERLGCLK
jgi:hypothetical protein